MVVADLKRQQRQNEELRNSIGTSFDSALAKEKERHDKLLRKQQQAEEEQKQMLQNQQRREREAEKKRKKLEEMNRNNNAKNELIELDTRLRNLKNGMFSLSFHLGFALFPFS